MHHRSALFSFTACAVMLLALGAPFSLHAGDAGKAARGKAPSIGISHAVAHATVPGQPAAAAYLTIENRGKSADKLVAVASPVARTAEIHSMSMQGDVMKMREVGEIVLPPAAVVAMKPGDGYHIMLMGLKKPLQAGEQVPLTLTFEKAGKVSVQAHVESRAQEKAAGTMQQHDASGHKHH